MSGPEYVTRTIQLSSLPESALTNKGKNIKIKPFALIDIKNNGQFRFFTLFLFFIWQVNATTIRF